MRQFLWHLKSQSLGTKASLRQGEQKRLKFMFETELKVTSRAWSTTGKSFQM